MLLLRPSSLPLCIGRRISDTFCAGLWFNLSRVDFVWEGCRASQQRLRATSQLYWQCSVFASGVFGARLNLVAVQSTITAHCRTQHHGNRHPALLASPFRMRSELFFPRLCCPVTLTSVFAAAWAHACCHWTMVVSVPLPLLPPSSHAFEFSCLQLLTSHAVRIEY